MSMLPEMSEEEMANVVVKEEPLDMDFTEEHKFDDPNTACERVFEPMEETVEIDQDQRFRDGMVLLKEILVLSQKDDLVNIDVIKRKENVILFLLATNYRITNIEQIRIIHNKFLEAKTDEERVESINLVREFIELYEHSSIEEKRENGEDKAEKGVVNSQKKDEAMNRVVDSQKKDEADNVPKSLIDEWDDDTAETIEENVVEETTSAKIRK